MSHDISIEQRTEQLINSGQSVDSIRSHLHAEGWDELKIDTAITSVATKLIDNSIGKNPNYEPKPSKPSINSRWIKVLITLIIILVILVSALLFLNQSRPQPSLVRPAAQTLEIKDKNYSITLPPGWKSRSSNVNGSGINAYYKTNDIGEELSRLNIYVLPTTNASNADTHISEQLKGLRVNNSQVSQEKKYPVELNAGQTGLVYETDIAMPSDPDSKTHYIFLAKDYEGISYNLDFVISKSEWERSKEEIQISIKTFFPKSTTLKKIP